MSQGLNPRHFFTHLWFLLWTDLCYRISFKREIRNQTIIKGSLGPKQLHEWSRFGFQEHYLFLLNEQNCCSRSLTWYFSIIWKKITIGYATINLLMSTTFMRFKFQALWWCDQKLDPSKLHKNLTQKWSFHVRWKNKIKFILRISLAHLKMSHPVQPYNCIKLLVVWKMVNSGKK